MAYFGILVVLFTALISGDRSLGDQRNYLAGFYMLTPALATLIARLFFCEPRFTDANLRLGGVSDYLKF